MAGVNLNEESARILATNSDLVGTQIRSCKDEAFLHPGLLHRRIQETGESRPLIAEVTYKDLPNVFATFLVSCFCIFHTPEYFKQI